MVLNTPYSREGSYLPRLAPVWFGYPFADLSYWVGLVFTLGCVAWVVNGHYALFAVGAAAAAASKTQAEVVSAVAAVVGGTLFEIGSWLLYWEALNQQPDVQTGKQLQNKQQSGGQAAPLDGNCTTSGRVSSRSTPSYDIEVNTQQQQPHIQAAQYILCPVANECPKLLRQRLQRAQRQGLQQNQQQQQQQFSPLLQDQVRPHSSGHPAAFQAPAGSTCLADGPLVDSATAVQTDSNGINYAAATTAAVAEPAAPATQPVKPSVSMQVLAKMSGEACGVPATGSHSIVHDQQHQQQQCMQPCQHQAAQKQSPVCRTKYQQQWIWFGLRYRDVGFAASLLQLIGATIFWVPCIFAVPGVYTPETEANYGVWDVAFWSLQMVGATFFIVSAWAFMVEEQPAWYLPQPQRIGWHVGFWNMVGSVGFFLSGAFGLFAVPQERFQISGMAGSTFWGSYAFLIGSYLQLLEAVNKHPDSLQWLPTQRSIQRP